MSEHSGPANPASGGADDVFASLDPGSREQFAAAIASRNASAVRLLLQRLPPEIQGAVTRPALAEVSAMQAAARSAAPEALHRYLRSYPEGLLASTAAYLGAKIEDAAFAVLLQTRSRAHAAKFLRDFPSSSRTPNVERLVASLDETARFRSALEALRRGNPAPASEAVYELSDNAMRGELLAALQDYQAGTRGRNLRLRIQGAFEELAGQFAPAQPVEPAVQPTAASRELQVARDQILRDLHELGGVLRDAAGEPERPAAVAEKSVPAAPPLPRQTREERAPSPLTLPATSRPRRSLTPGAIVAMLVTLAAVAWLLLTVDDRAGETIARRARQLASAVTTPREEAPALPAPGELRIEVVPSGEVVSVTGEGKEWVPRPLAAPATLELPPGTYEVVVLGPDHRSRKAATVDIIPDVTQTTRAEFEPLYLEPAPKR